MRITKILAALAVAAAAVPAAASAQSLVNGGFETNVPGSFNTYSAGDTGLVGWNIDSGSVDHIGGYWQPASGSGSLDLSGYNAGTISQSFSTIAGQQYAVDFAMAVNPGGYTSNPILSVIATGGQAATYSFLGGPNSASNMGWELNRYLFTALGTTTNLSFSSLNNSVYGPALDDISVSSIAAAVPEPATWLTMIMGFGLIGMVLRQRGRKGAVAA